MKLTFAQKKTVEYYDRSISEWAIGRNVHLGKSNKVKEFENFAKYQPSGKLLDIGFGSGVDVKEILSQGYQYVGIDPSIECVKYAKKMCPGVNFIQSSIEEVDFKEDSFDGFWAGTSLLHIPKRRIVSVLKLIKKIVRNGGVGYISLKEGVGEKIDIATGRFFSLYQMDEFLKILRSVGYIIISSEVIDYMGRRLLSILVKVKK